MGKEATIELLKKIALRRKDQMSKIFILLVIGYCLVCSFGFAAAESKKVSEFPITADELCDHVYYLASDYLNGRAPGLMGYEIAANYVASQFKQAGLDTVITSPDGSGTFFQEVSLRRRRLDRFTITVRSRADSSLFELGHHFKPRLIDFSMNGDLVAKAIFVGFGISEPDAGWDDLDGLDLEGKVVIVLRGAPTRDGKGILPKEMHERYDGPRGMTPKLESIARFNPAVIIAEASPRALERWEDIPNDGPWPTVVHDEGDSTYYHFINMDIPRFNLLGTNILIAKRPFIEAVLATQRYHPFNKDGAVAETEYRTFDIEDVSIHIARSYDDEMITTWNVVAGLEGSDPDLKDEFVIVGAHLDHFPPRRGQVMNGADDNASGCAGVMEIAEALSNSRPRRSVLFVLLTAEEIGLLGSRHFARNLPVPAEKAKLYINVDMIGRTVEELREQRGVYISGSALLCDTLWNMLNDVNDPDFGIGLTQVKDDETFKRTDQFFFFDKGIPTIGFETGYHEDYHRPTDDPEKLDYDKARDVSRLVQSFILKLGSIREPICDAEKREMKR
jgi:hypothetical protein